MTVVGVLFAIAILFSVAHAQISIVCGTCPLGFDTFIPNFGTPEWCCMCQQGCAKLVVDCPGRYCVDQCMQFANFCPTPEPILPPPITMAPPPPPPDPDMPPPPATTSSTTLQPTPAPTPVPPPLTLPTGPLASTGSDVSQNASLGTDAADIANTNTEGGGSRRGVDGLTIGAAVGGVSAGLALMIVAFIVFRIVRRRRNAGAHVDDGIVTNDAAIANSRTSGTFDSFMNSARSERSSTPAPGNYGIVPRNEQQVFQYEQYGDGNINHHQAYNN